jgi:uncharacterized surface protein with fasciclin (FAS1) repeats
MDQSKGTPNMEAARNNPTGPARNIVDTAMDAGNFSIFAAAIGAAGLTEALAAKGPFTVFAPTDAAFKKLPTGAYDELLKDTGKLKAILNYHVIPGHVMAKDLKAGEVMTQQGTTLTSTPSSSTNVRVNSARVVKADLVASNGVIHAIDAVILPKNWQLTAAAA